MHFFTDTSVASMTIWQLCLVVVYVIYTLVRAYYINSRRTDYLPSTFYLTEEERRIRRQSDETPQYIAEKLVKNEKHGYKKGVLYSYVDHDDEYLRLYHVLWMAIDFLAIIFASVYPLLKKFFNIRIYKLKKK